MLAQQRNFYKRVATPKSIDGINRLLSSRLLTTMITSTGSVLRERRDNENRLYRYFWYSVYGGTCVASGLVLTVASAGSFIVVNTVSLFTFRYVPSRNFELTILWRAFRQSGKEGNLSLKEMMKLLAFEIAAHPDVFHMLGQLNGETLLEIAKEAGVDTAIINQYKSLTPEVLALFNTLLGEINNKDLQSLIYTLRDFEMASVKTKLPVHTLASAISIARTILSSKTLERDISSLVKNPVIKSTILDFYRDFLAKSYGAVAQEQDEFVLVALKPIENLTKEQKQEVEDKVSAVKTALDTFLNSDILAQVTLLCKTIVSQTKVQHWKALFKAYNRDEEEKDYNSKLIKTAIPLLRTLANDKVFGTFKAIIENESLDNLLKLILGTESNRYKQFTWLKAHLDEILSITKDLLRTGLYSILDQVIIFVNSPDTKSLQAITKACNSEKGGLFPKIKEHSKTIATLINSFPTPAGLILNFEAETVDKTLDLVTGVAQDLAGEIVETYKEIERNNLYEAFNLFTKNPIVVSPRKMEEFLPLFDEREKNNGGLLATNKSKTINLATRIMDRDDTKELLNLAIRSTNSKDEKVSERLNLLRDSLASDDFHQSLQDILQAVPLLKTELPALSAFIKKANDELKDMLSKSASPQALQTKSEEVNKLIEQRQVLVRRSQRHLSRFFSSFADMIQELKDQGKLIEHTDTLEWLVDTMLFDTLLGTEKAQQMQSKIGYTPKDLIHNLMKDPNILNAFPGIIHSVLLKDDPWGNLAPVIIEAIPSTLFYGKTLIPEVVSSAIAQTLGKENLSHILEVAAKKYKEPNKVIIRNNTDFGNQTYFRLKFANCKAIDLNISSSTITRMDFTNADITELDASTCTVTHLTIKNSSLKDCNFWGLKAQHVVLDNVSFDAKTLTQLMESIRDNPDLQSISIKNLKEPQGINKQQLRDLLSTLPNISHLAEDNPEFPSFKDLYTADSVAEDIFQAMRAKTKNLDVLMLKQCLKKSLANLNAEELKELIRIKDDIVGAEAGYYWGAGSGLLQYLSNDYLEYPTMLQDNISDLITEKIRKINYDKEGIVTRLEDKTHELLEEMPEEETNLTPDKEDLQKLKNIVSKVIKNVDEKYISLLNKKSEELIGDRHYSYFSGYYYTGLLSIMHEVSYTKPEAMEKEIKQIFIDQLGATANIFKDDMMPEQTKNR